MNVFITVRVLLVDTNVEQRDRLEVMKGVGKENERATYHGLVVLYMKQTYREKHFPLCETLMEQLKTPS